MGPQYHVLVEIASVEEARWVNLLPDVVVYVIFACSGGQSDGVIDFIAFRRLAAQAVHANSQCHTYLRIYVRQNVLQKSDEKMAMSTI